MKVVQLPNLRRAKIWLGELPQLKVHADRVLAGDIKTSRPSFPESRRVAIEMSIPQGARSLYGLLGGELQKGQTGAFRYEVSVSTASGRPFEDSIAPSPEDARIGLPEEYAQAVVDGLSEAGGASSVLPSGRMIISCAAHGAIGSSRLLFKRLARALAQILIADRLPSSEEQAAAFLTFEL